MSMMALSDIRTDGGTQSRASLYQNIIEDYSAALGEGASFRPVVVFYDGREHWLADGFHRYHAHQKLGLVEIGVDIRQGTRRDAVLHSVGANDNHGLRRTNEDKRRAVLTLLNDDEWVKWSDREVARQCSVSHEFVRRLRPVTVNVDSEKRTFITKHGTTSTMDVGPIGKPSPVRLIDPHQAREYLDVAKEIRAERADEKRAARTKNLTQLSNRNAPPPTDRRYPIIYADPPWQYDFSPSNDRSVENHYPTMPIEEILALSVEELATPDAMLFLWAPPSFIKKGIATLEAWGFELATSMVWVKDRIGTGIYVRQRHEYLLLGKRGQPITPRPGSQPDSVIEAPRQKHSAKPDQIYDLIEKMYPDLPKIELFCRSPRSGWDAWGNQAEAA